MNEALFDYDRGGELGIRQVGQVQEEGYSQRLFTYMTPGGVRRAAEIFSPAGEGPFAAILYVHWLAETPDANRTQFEEEALEMAKRGAVCLLVEAMWSERDWFIKRTQEEDFDNSVRQVIELRQAMDLLLSQPGVDAGRFAYVGHDFGAMYGTVMGAVDPRPTCYVLMAATPRFSDWYLYYPKLEGEARQAFIEKMGEIDPITHVGRLSPRPVFFQFATDDEHVSKERAVEFSGAAGEPKKIGWYEARHELNEKAKKDRMAWVVEQLGL
jgi:dienelactone hydrolase